MSKAPMIARILLGLVFFVFGLNGFFHFIPTPPLAEPLSTFFQGLVASVYFLPLLAGVQVLCGIMLLSGAFVPLALVVLAPVILNIFLVHLFIDHSGLPIALFIGILEIYLSFFAKPYSNIVKQIFRCPMKEAMEVKKEK